MCDEVMSICDHCTQDLEANSIEPACKDCGVDGLCSDCMTEHRLKKHPTKRRTTK